MLTWPRDLLKGNMLADNTPIYEDVEKVVSFASVVSFFLNLSLFRFCYELQQEAERLVKKA